MNCLEVIADRREPQDIADVLGIELEKATEIHAAAKRESEENLAPTAVGHENHYPE